MSLSWIEQRVMILDASAVGLFRLGADGPEELQRLILPADATHADLLSSVSELLRQNASARCRLRVLVSSHLVRFALVPWREEIASPRELLAFTQFCFEQAYGLEPLNWSYTVSPEDNGQARIAAAMPAELLAALQALSRESGYRLLEVQPYLAAVFNRFCRHVMNQTSLFVVVEPGRAGVLHAGEGQWRGVRALACADSPDALAALIAREQLLLELSDHAVQAVFVHGANPAFFEQLESGLGCPVHQLGESNQASEPVDSMRLMTQAVA